MAHQLESISTATANVAARQIKSRA